MDRIQLPGVAFSGYRSFAGSPQKMRFETPVTVLAGINNCGKSNVLRYVQHVLPQLLARTPAHRRPASVLNELDLPTGFAASVTHTLAVPMHVAHLDKHQKSHALRYGRLADAEQAFTVLASLMLDDDGAFWPRFTVAENGDLQVSDQFTLEAVRAVESWCQASEDRHTPHAFEANLGRHLGISGSVANPEFRMTVYRRALMNWSPHREIGLRVVSIGPNRRIEAASSNSRDESDGSFSNDWLTGRGMIGQLSALQNPNHSRWESDRLKWSQINQFVRHVIDDHSASINIPHDGAYIQVETPRRILPLSSLGSGVEQVVVLAAAATVIEKHVICLEEPETNLHPILQKKLVRYLSEETTNQYLIATHSAHFLDYERSTVYHLRNSEVGTIVERAERPRELFRVARDLGYSPSDLLQANCLIWVEGPADRIYVRRWLEIVAPDLVESVHFSIMFYGGSLVSHLSAQEELSDRLEDFILLNRLNRSTAIIIDSDRRKPRARLKPAVRRLASEFSADGALCWITKGYTIENYVPPDILREAVTQTHPRSNRYNTGHSLYESPLTAGAHKVAIARKAVASMNETSLAVADLRKRTEALANFIRGANAQNSSNPQRLPG